jgi:hypothetical protein
MAVNSCRLRVIPHPRKGPNGANLCDVDNDEQRLLSATSPFEVVAGNRKRYTYGIFAAMTSVFALWLDLLPAAFAGSKGCFLYEIVQDKFEYYRNSAYEF